MIGPFDIGTGADWTRLRGAFRWPQPQSFNIGWECCGRWAQIAPERTALLWADESGRLDAWSWRRLDREVNRCANALEALGAGRGERVAILLAQRPETLVAHLAAYKLGAVATPLFAAFGSDAIAYRMQDAKPAALICDAAGLAKTPRSARDAIATLCVDGPADGARGWRATLDAASDTRPAPATAAEDAAFLSYTSGTTGAPKGALHSHRTLLGHLPAIQMWTEGLGAADRAAPARAVCWTPADWAWLGGLCNLLLPALYYGATVLSAPMRPFDPDRALGLCARFGVSHAFLPPTALRILRGAAPAVPAGMRLQAIGAAGEAVGGALKAWTRAEFGAEVNEFYGQTECNGVIGWSSALGPRPADMSETAMGVPLPGFDVGVDDGAGEIRRRGAAGELVVRAPNPSLMLGYWRRPKATAERVAAGWLRTGDRARIDDAGVFTFEGRVDDVINSAGYRIGPAEIEDCLTRHPAVAQAGVVAQADRVRGEAVAAFVVPSSALSPATRETLAEQLTWHVRERLGGYAAPKQIRFVEALPTTETGKIIRRELRARITG